MDKIVAFIDEQPCSLAAVRKAIAFADRGGLLRVVLVGPRVPMRIALSWSQGLCVPDLREEAVEETFRAVAELIAPTGLPWDFAVRVRPRCGGAAPDPAVTVRHRGGLFHPLRATRRVERFAQACRAGTALVVGCDHGRTAGVPHPAPQLPSSDAPEHR